MSKRSFFFALVLLCPLATVFVACDDATDVNPAPHDAGPSDAASDAPESGSGSEAGPHSDAGSDASDASSDAD
jgi:hypothetical protein